MKTMTSVEQYSATRTKSKNLYEQAKRFFPSGVTHDTRFMKPFPIYVTHAQGSRKWDVDGNEYIDYMTGHGAMILGHGNPQVVEAVCEQMRKGTHYGSCHDLEVEWGQLIQDLVPSCERIKFFSSGTEAVHMALRLARAYTGKSKILKFQGHFHGWSDHMTAGVQAPWDVPVSVGVLPEDVKHTIVLPINDAALVERTIREDGDVAVIILEPAGFSTGTVPVKEGFHKELRRIADATGAVLIFDEVVTGFRVTPGGMQQRVGVRPDLTTMAKIVAGGLPGGALGGKAEILEPLEFKDDPQANRMKRVSHPGTYNANPLSAAAGVACLKQIKTGEPNRIADLRAAQIKEGINQVFKQTGVKGNAYGISSSFHVHIGSDDPPETPDDLKVTPAAVSGAIKRLMLTNGVDFMRNGGFTGMAHTEEDVEKTVQAFRDSLDTMLAEGMLQR